MAQIEERVKYLFGAAIESKMAVADTMVAVIAKAGNRLVHCLLNDGKIIVCGNGGSAANCLHFSSAMLNRFEIDRPALPVIHLSADISAVTGMVGDGHFNQVFARQIQALGCTGDVLITISTSGNADNLLQAINAANDRGMDIIALNGRDGGLLANHLGPEDIELRVSGDNSARVREIHLFILNCFCDLIEQSLFGQLPGTL